MVNLEALARDHRFDHQLKLVREHWTSVRRLWLKEADAPEALRRLRLNFPDDFMLGCGMPGLATIKPAVDGLFEFTKDGLTAVIIPAYDTIPGNLDANAEAHVEHLVDLVAVELDHPEPFWRRRGEALVLGAAFLEIARQEGEPVPVFRNPMSWLQSAGAGVVVLDWDYARALLLDLELIAEDVALGERLDAALKPNIWVMGVAA